MKKVILSILLGIGFIFAECPDGFYEDDCGNCWLPYCYDYVSHNVQYDLNEEECTGQTQIWVFPGDQGDPLFNNYCESCPDGFYEDDCGHCWLSYCYTLFEMPMHTTYFDMGEDECLEQGYMYVTPGDSGDPYYNSNCPEDTCSECMSFCISNVMDNYGYSEEDATYWCSTTPNSQNGCADSCLDEDAYCGTGDSNFDDSVDVLDIVLSVSIALGDYIGNDQEMCASDSNEDGSVDVLDIVLTVSWILGTRGVEADRAEIILNGSDVFYSSNGTIGAFQMILSHNNAFELSLTDNAFVSDYRTIDNLTTLIIVAPEGNHLFTASGDYVVEDVLAATTNGYIDIDMENPLSYSISSAYPNPFNPSTTISIDLNTDAQVNISVYNAMGQLMDVLFNDNLGAGSYPFIWNAQDAPSGMYFIKSEVDSEMSTQKILLLK